MNDEDLPKLFEESKDLNLEKLLENLKLYEDVKQEEEKEDVKDEKTIDDLEKPLFDEKEVKKKLDLLMKSWDKK